MVLGNSPKSSEVHVMAIRDSASDLPKETQAAYMRLAVASAKVRPLPRPEDLPPDALLELITLQEFSLRFFSGEQLEHAQAHITDLRERHRQLTTGGNNS